MEQENNNYQPNAQAFLDAIAKDETTISPRPQQQFLEEEFPFTDDFDIDAFVAANDNPLEKTLTAMKAAPAPQNTETKDFNIDLQKDKDENIKELETKIASIQNQIEDTSKEQPFSSLPSELFEEQPAQNNYVSSIKANDEFFTNISKTIDTLKGSLDNIVKARLQYEEGLVRQDQTLITRLREKTSRLKAINLALNSEVKRAKNEKLESLRKSAEQTKELLALRMQINQFQEQSKQGDFKLSRLEEQLNMAVQEKQILEEEIAKIRQEKLDSFKASAEQTRQIMALRFDLAKTEDKFKQQEAQTLSLQNQLEDFKQKAAQGDKDLYQGQIASLQTQLEQALFASKNEAGLAGSLRENILFLETSLAKTQGAKTALLAKASEHLENLFGLKNKYEQEINLIKNEQLKLLENSYQQEEQKSAELTNQVKQTLAVCRQQEGFIKTLQVQIDSFKQAIAELDKNAPLEKIPSSEISLLKEAHLREISSLQKTLIEEQNKYRNQNLEYQNLSSRLYQTEQQKQVLEKQLSDLLSSKEENQKANNQYLRQIEELKKNYESLQAKYKTLGSQNTDRQIFEFQKNALENELKTVLTQKIALMAEVEEKNKMLASFKNRTEEQTKKLKEEAQQQITILENKLAGAQEKLSNEEETVNSLKAKIEELQNSLNTKEQDKRGFVSQEISNLRDQLVKAQNKFALESALLSQLQEESSSKKEEFATLETKYKELLAQKESLQSKMAEQAKQIENLQTSLNNLQEELKAEKTARLQLEEKVSKLKAVNMALSTQIKQYREQKFAALKKSAQQAKEILALKEELAKAENFKTIELENGIVNIRKEYETKISSLEKQLKDLSERFAKQVQEIESLKTDNIKLKKAQEEKFSLEEQYNNLTLHAKELEDQITSYQKNAQETSLAKAKAAALSVQLLRVKEEKKSLSDQLAQTRLQIKTLDDDGKEARKALTVLKDQIVQNDDLITKLRQDISSLKQVKQESSKQTTKIVPVAKEQTVVNQPTLPQAPISDNRENKTETFSQTYTEPPTAPIVRKPAQASVKPEPSYKKIVPQTQSVAGKEIEQSANSYNSSNNGFVSTTKREELFKEILPDAQEVQTDTFSSTSTSPVNATTQTSKQVLDLSMIFGAKESIEIQDMEESNKQGQSVEDTEKIKLSSAPAAPAPLEEEPITDHSIKTNLRRAVAKEGVEYSDFLGKTKSVFYRIKWSLFKE